MLLDSNLLFREPDSPAVLSSGTGRHWPDGRGVFVCATGVSAWINEEDHFRLMLASWMEGDQEDGEITEAGTWRNRWRHGDIMGSALYAFEWVRSGR